MTICLCWCSCRVVRGFEARLLNPSSDGWIAEAVKHFRVVLPDQRGTGSSSRVDSHAMAEARRRGARAQADYLKRFLADSIVRDFEHLRRTEFGGSPWVTLGQSYGGFLTLTYLSLFPEGVAASFTCGGIPHVPANATEVYEHTFPRMAARPRSFTSATASMPIVLPPSRISCRPWLRSRKPAASVAIPARCPREPRCCRTATR